MASRRSTLVAVLAIGVLAAPPPVPAQPPARVAFLCPSSCSNLPNVINRLDEAFLRGIARGGDTYGRNVEFDVAGAGVGYGRLFEAAKRLVARRADVIVARGSEAVRAARRATPSVPIVMPGVADPVENGLIASLGRPGNNVTGLSVPSGELAAKHLQLLREIRPGPARIAVLREPGSARSSGRLARVEAAPGGRGVEVHAAHASSPGRLRDALASASRGPVDGVSLLDLQGAGSEVVRFGLERKIPTIGSYRQFVDAGALMAYGPDLVDLYERAASYTARILGGVKPGELPVEEPTRFVLIVSRVTARALGVTIPPSVLARADEIVE